MKTEKERKTELWIEIERERTDKNKISAKNVKREIVHI